LPSELLAPFVAHFWWVRWRLSRPFVAETVPHPTVHVVFEGTRGTVVGVPLARFVRRLEGEGRVFGVKLRPAMFQPFGGGSVAELAGRRRPIAALFGDEGRALARTLREARSLEEAIDRAEPFFVKRRPVLSREAAEVRDLVERIEHDRAVVRVEQAARIAQLPVRTLERRFRRYVGIGPKAVIRRYRLIEAAEQLKRDEATPLADLAAALGYSDQPHFARDWKALVGRSPRSFAIDRKRR
jgi:AraC-like DNA-binding protein